jgi:hypothetical protein
MKLEPAVLAVCLAFVATAAAPLAAEPAAAVWETHQLKFHYSGFTSAYSCEGIKQKVKDLLRAIGARDDVKVDGVCPVEAGSPFPFYNLILAFSVPVEAEAGVAVETFPGEWQEVQIGYNRPSGLAWGDCELVEQFRDQVLPVLSPREIRDKTRCVPHQLSPGSFGLTVTVLKPAATAGTP